MSTGDAKAPANGASLPRELSRSTVGIFLSLVLLERAVEVDDRAVVGTDGNGISGPDRFRAQLAIGDAPGKDRRVGMLAHAARS